MGGDLGLLADSLNLANPERRSCGRGGPGCRSGVKNFPRQNENPWRATEHARWWKGRVPREFRQEEGEAASSRGKGTPGPSVGEIKPQETGTV